MDCLTEQVHGPTPDLSWLDESGIELVRGSVCDSQTCVDALAGIDTIVHLAAETGTGQSMYEIRRYLDTNVTGTGVLLEACIQKQVRKVVLSSSRAVYGEGMWICARCGPVHPSLRPSGTGPSNNWAPLCPTCQAHVVDLLPTPEDAPNDPTSVYGISKLTQELLVRRLREAHSLDVSILRFFNVFGPGQSLSNPYTGVLAVFLNRARQNRTIDLYEDGQIIRDFVFVDDVVEAVAAAIRVHNPPVCNIGSGRIASIRELAETITRLVDSVSHLVITGKGRAGDVRGLQADINRAANALAWAPQVSLEEGLEHFVAWAACQPFEDLYEQSLSELSLRGLYR